jgi:hypothetical protein
MAADGGTSAVSQFEPPAVQGADHLTLLKPSQTEGAAGMGTSARKSKHLGVDPEDRQPQPGGVTRHTSADPNLVEPANRDPLGHAIQSRNR